MSLQHKVAPPTMKNLRIQKYLLKDLKKRGEMTVDHIVYNSPKESKMGSSREFKHNLRLLLDSAEVEIFEEGTKMVQLTNRGHLRLRPFKRFAMYIFLNWLPLLALTISILAMMISALVAYAEFGTSWLSIL